MAKKRKRKRKSGYREYIPKEIKPADNIGIEESDFGDLTHFVEERGLTPETLKILADSDNDPKIIKQNAIDSISKKTYSLGSSLSNLGTNARKKVSSIMSRVKGLREKFTKSVKDIDQPETEPGEAPEDTGSEQKELGILDETATKPSAPDQMENLIDTPYSHTAVETTDSETAAPDEPLGQDQNPPKEPEKQADTGKQSDITTKKIHDQTELPGDLAEQIADEQYDKILSQDYTTWENARREYKKLMEEKGVDDIDKKLDIIINKVHKKYGTKDKYRWMEIQTTIRNYTQKQIKNMDKEKITKKSEPVAPDPESGPKPEPPIKKSPSEPEKNTGPIPEKYSLGPVKLDLNSIYKWDYPAKQLTMKLRYDGISEQGNPRFEILEKNGSALPETTHVKDKYFLLSKNYLGQTLPEGVGFNLADNKSKSEKNKDTIQAKIKKIEFLYSENGSEFKHLRVEILKLMAAEDSYQIYSDNTRREMANDLVKEYSNKIKQSLIEKISSTVPPSESEPKLDKTAEPPANTKVEVEQDTAPISERVDQTGNTKKKEPAGNIEQTDGIEEDMTAEPQKKEQDPEAQKMMEKVSKLLPLLNKIIHMDKYRDEVGGAINNTITELKKIKDNITQGKNCQDEYISLEERKLSVIFGYLVYKAGRKTNYKERGLVITDKEANKDLEEFKKITGFELLEPMYGQIFDPATQEIERRDKADKNQRKWILQLIRSGVKSGNTDKVLQKAKVVVARF